MIDPTIKSLLNDWRHTVAQKENRTERKGSDYG